MTSRPPKAPRRTEYLKNGNFCRNVLLRLIALKPHLQMQTSPLDRPFLSCSDHLCRMRVAERRVEYVLFSLDGCQLELFLAKCQIKMRPEVSCCHGDRCRADRRDTRPAAYTRRRRHPAGRVTRLRRARLRRN